MRIAPCDFPASSGREGRHLAVSERVGAGRSGMLGVGWAAVPRLWLADWPEAAAWYFPIRESPAAKYLGVRIASARKRAEMFC